MRSSVDRIHDHEELVVKPAAPAVMATGLYAGTTLADDGSPILLFDPAGLAQVGGVKLEAQERAARIAEGPAAASQGDAGAAVPRPRRRAPRASPRGRRPDRGSAGRARSSERRSASGPGRRCHPAACRGRARPSSARTRSACSASTTARTRSATRSPKSSTSRRSTMTSFTPSVPGEISGVSLINGEPAELVDAHWLFADHVGAAARATEQLVCRVPGGDPWMQNMLRPIVEAAGYRVIGDERRRRRRSRHRVAGRRSRRGCGEEDDLAADRA